MRRQHPHFNPTQRREKEPSTPSIEMAFPELRTLLRSAAEGAVEGLWPAILQFIETVTPDECAIFNAAGCELANLLLTPWRQEKRRPNFFLPL